MKKLYEFKLNKIVEDKVSKIIKNDKNEDVEILEKVNKEIPHSFFIAKPTRSLTEEGEIYYASIVSDCVKKGILSVSLLQKRFLNDGGILSEEQRKEYENLYKTLFDKQAIHKQLLDKNDPTDDEKKETVKIFNEIVDILTKIQSFEAQTGNTLYQNTAENIARNRIALWWTLNLSYKEENGKQTPVFDGRTYEDKLKQYDKLTEDGDDFYLQLLNKLYLVTSIWNLGKAEKQEDFDIMLKMYENQNLINVVASTPVDDKEKV